MAPSTNTATLPLVFGQEVVLATIAGPFDLLDAYVDGKGAKNSGSEWRLYATVAGLRSRVATAQYGGPAPSILQWAGAKGPYEPASADGATYELVGYWAGVGTPPTVKASMVGYDVFDTVADASAQATVNAPSGFVETTIATLAGGYAAFADVSVNQGFSGRVQFTLYALAGAGGVEAPVASAEVSGSSGNVRVMPKTVLPGATSYRLAVTSLSGSLVSGITASLACYSTLVSASAVVTLAGDTDGPSNANTTRKWLNIALAIAGGITMAVPLPGSAPQFEPVSGKWSNAKQPTIPLEFFGATGTTDDGPVINTALTALSSGAYAYNIALLCTKDCGIITPIQAKNNTTLLLAEDFTFTGAVVGGSTSDVILHYGPPGFDLGSTTVSAPAKLFGNTVQVTSLTNITVGVWIGLFNGDWGFRGGYYNVLAIDVPSKTLTLDRPILWPFSNATHDTCAIWSTNPRLENFAVIGLGRGAIFQGQCIAFTNIVGGHNCLQAGLRGGPKANAIAGDAGFVYQTGYANEMVDIDVDGSNGSSNNKGIGFASEEHGSFHNLISRYCTTVCIGIVDCMDCDFENLNAYNGADIGINFGTEISSSGYSTVQGCCWNRCKKLTSLGNGFIGIQISIGSSYNDFYGTNVSGAGNTQNPKGLELANAGILAEHNRFYGTDARGCSVAGVNLQAGFQRTHFDGIDLTDCVNGMIVADSCTILAPRANCTVGSIVSNIQLTGNNAVVDIISPEFVHTGVAMTGILVDGTCTAHVKGGFINPATGGIAIWIQGVAATVYVEDLKGTQTNAGGFGLVSQIGSIIVGDGVDFTGVTVPNDLITGSIRKSFNTGAVELASLDISGNWTLVDTLTPPAAPATGGGTYYLQVGDLKFISDLGNITTIAPR